MTKKTMKFLFLIRRKMAKNVMGNCQCHGELPMSWGIANFDTKISPYPAIDTPQQRVCLPYKRL